MNKILNQYGGFTAQNIKDRAELPLQAYMTVNGTTVECVTIPTTAIKNVLGAGSTAVGGLCTSPNVNQWSNYSSREWVINTYPNMVNQIKAPYTMGSFMGYNHNAVEPTSFNSSFEFVKGAAGSTRTIEIAEKVKMGEYDWQKLGATHCRVVTFAEGGGIYSQSGILPINGAGEFITFNNVSFTFSTATVGTTSYITKTYICASDGSDIAELPIQGSVTCTIIASFIPILSVKVSGNVKSFTMQDDTNYSSGSYVLRSGKYSGIGTVADKTLSSIVYDLLNKTTNAVESTLTVTSFNGNEYPTMLSDMAVNDLEGFSASQLRLIPSTNQYLRISMNYI